MEGDYVFASGDVGVLTGGFSEQELTEAGATVVFDSVEQLREHLIATNLQDTISG